MANGATVHLQQAIESICPHNPLAAGCRESPPRDSLWQDSCRSLLCLLRISQAFAVPPAELFAFVNQGHQPCAFIPTKQLALYADPHFWQYGLLAFVSGCCAFNDEQRHKQLRTTKADPTEQEETSENDVDAFTFMQTVIMSFVRGMTHGEQILPINDLFVYLVESIGQRGFSRAEVKSGWGYRPRKEGAEDNPLLAAGVYSKEVSYSNEPQMPDTTWAERAYVVGALDPSLGQSMSFPSLPQLKLRLEVPLWRDLGEARYPPMETHSDESDADSDITGERELSPRYAQPVPIGAADPAEQEAEESIEEEDTTEDPKPFAMLGWPQH